MLLTGQGKREPRKDFQLSNVKVIGDSDSNSFSGGWDEKVLRTGEELFEQLNIDASFVVNRLYFILKASNSDVLLI